MERLAEMRTAVGVIVGYVLFAAASVLLFVMSERQPHDEASLGFMLVATTYGVVAALLCGLMAAAISGRQDARAGVILAVVIGLGAIVSMFTVPEGGSRSSMIAALLLMAPAAWLGGKSLTILKQQLTNPRQETPGGRA